MEFRAKAHGFLVVVGRTTNSGAQRRRVSLIRVEAHSERLVQAGAQGIIRQPRHPLHQDGARPVKMYQEQTPSKKQEVEFHTPALQSPWTPFQVSTAGLSSSLVDGSKNPVLRTTKGLWVALLELGENGVTAVLREPPELYPVLRKQAVRMIRQFEGHESPRHADCL